MQTLQKVRRRRQPTAAQKAKAAERKAKMHKLARSVSAMSKEQRAQLAGRFGVVTIEGRALSPFNACMIWSQNPAATVVGGFRQWLKAGRCVAKGQHGMAIWVPCKPKGDGKPNDPDSPDDTYFILKTVFDVSQTAETDTEGGAR